MRNKRPPQAEPVAGSGAKSSPGVALEAEPPAVKNDTRSAIDLPADENAELCAGCVRCCSYITVEVDSPRAAWEYDQWMWAVDHEHVSLYVEKPERWFVHFDTRCNRLDTHGRCSIHGRHPVLCREYDPRSCERRLPLAEVAAWFNTSDELQAWIKRQRPRHWERWVEYRRAHETPKSDDVPGFVPLTQIVNGARTNGAGRSNGTARTRVR